MKCWYSQSWNFSWLFFFFSCCCPIFLSHYVVAATRSLVNAPAPWDGQGFTVMRPARLDTMERDACCFAAAPMELTAILSQAPVYVPRGSRWVPSLLFEVSGSVLLLFETSCFFFFVIYFILIWPLLEVYILFWLEPTCPTLTQLCYTSQQRVNIHSLTERKEKEKELWNNYTFKKKTH